MVTHIAQQLGIPAQAFAHYSWEVRTIKRHRAQIRVKFGFREPTVQDLEQLQEWLIQYLNDTGGIKHIDDTALERLREHLNPQIVRGFRRRAAVEPPRELRRHPDSTRYSLLAAFCWSRGREITDNLVDLLIQVIHRIGTRAEKKVNKELLTELKKVHEKDNILFLLAEAALQVPDVVIREDLFPVVGEQTLQNLVKEFKVTGPAYRLNVQARMKRSYSHHYRRMLPKILSILEFRSNNDMHQPLIEAIELLKRHSESRLQYYPSDENVPIDGVIPTKWLQQLYKKDSDNKRVHRISYELGTLEALRERLRTKEIWFVGADLSGMWPLIVASLVLLLEVWFISAPRFGTLRYC